MKTLFEVLNLSHEHNLLMKEFLKVGDRIMIMNGFNDFIVTVFSTTLTKATARDARNNEFYFRRDRTGGIVRFKREERRGLLKYKLVL